VSRKTEIILSLAILLGLILDTVAFLSALAPGPDSAINRFYRPAVWAVELLCGKQGALQALFFFLCCTSQNALSVALALLPFHRHVHRLAPSPSALSWRQP
jgi:hypothetical protein